MAFSYDAGSSTPGYAGLIEVGSIRLNSALTSGTSLAGGTFKVDDTGNPFLMTPPVRLPTAPFPADSGGYAPAPLFDPWPFTLTGWLWVPSGPDDVPAAEDLLRSVFSAANGPLTMIGNARGWSTRRKLVAQTNGSITFSARHGTLRIPTRNFSVPMEALDPIAYDADTLTSVTLPMDNSAHAFANIGTAPVAYAARFTGPWNTAASLIRNADGAEITLTMSLAAGRYVDVTVTPGDLAAVLDDGTDLYTNVSASSGRMVRSGTENWRAAGSSGTTGASQVVASFRSGWA